MVYQINDTIDNHILDEISNLEVENALLKNWIRSNAEKARCAACGEPIYQLSMQRMMRPFLWHSRKCFENKPGKIIALERDFGCDIVEILKETTKKCGNIRAQCHVLGVSIPYLYIIMNKYCGDRIAFMAQHATGKRRELYAKKIAKRKARIQAKNNGNGH